MSEHEAPAPDDFAVAGQRLAARALLFNPAGEMLLIKYRGNPHVHVYGRPPVLADHWGTAGGGIDAGEDIAVALAREITEETGHTRIEIGREIWRRQARMMFKGKPLVLDERYFVVHTQETAINTDRYTEFERSYVLESRWWKARDIATTAEIILPPALPPRIEAIAAGIYPPQIETISEDGASLL